MTLGGKGAMPAPTEVFPGRLRSLGALAAHLSRVACATLAVGAVSLLLLATASAALAAGPVHKPLPALDVTGLDHACGAAVDSEGDLYFSSAGESKVNVYDPSHALLTSIPEANEPCGLAVTTTGVLYVSEKGTGEVVRFKPNAYPFSGTPSFGSREVVDASGKAMGIAVDRFDNHLYVAEGDRVAHYNAEGKPNTVDERQEFFFENATGGTFTIAFEGQKTAPISFGASSAEVQAAMEGLSSIGSGNVEVKKSGEAVYLVTFRAALGSKDVPMIEVNGSGLTGSEVHVSTREITKGVSSYLGEGTLTEATGVAAYSLPVFPSGHETPQRYLWVADATGAGSLDLFHGEGQKPLKLQRKLTGATTPAGSFGFGAAGAYLAADPGNRKLNGECAVTGEQACTAGHIFLYDATHEALDEFDAAGEYLDQISDPALADAEPTAVAVDRSKGAHDGTIYVTAGASSGAKALAFAPLSPPRRKTRDEPLSHVLKGDEGGAATDSHGDLYVGVGASIHVYGPDGAQITEFEDPHKVRALSVDSSGNVYVLDVNNGFSPEQELTYYAPSQYPPTEKTVYARRPEPVALPDEFPPSNRLISAMAVVPGPSPAKDRLLVASGGTGDFIRLYDSAAKGSGVINEEFAQGLIPGSIRSLAVNGRTGTVYVGVNLHEIIGVDEAGKEVLAQFEPTGPAAGAVEPNPLVAVDQANGHVFVYDDGVRGREYDAAGSFVAEFGNFTKHLLRNMAIAVDDACAQHVPPLDETTAPTCEEFDPSNGTVYIAKDDTNPEHPPYDVTAFGPLSYGGEAPTAVTGGVSGLGEGKANFAGTVNPNEEELEECAFDYVEESRYEQNQEESKPLFEGGETAACVPGPAEIGAGTEPVPVQAEVTLPDPNGAYRFALRATNPNGEGEGEAVLFGSPQVEAEAALPVLYTEATLRAKVNPSGLATEYRFDYLDRQSFEEQGGFEGPATSHTAWQSLSPGEKGVPVSGVATGLEEGTEYLYRAVAANEAAVAEGPAAAFATQVRRPVEACANQAYRFGFSANLPDCRAYELVTPAQTNGLPPRAETIGGAPSPNSWLTVQNGEAAGERLSYFTNGTLPGFEGNGSLDGYRAERGAGAHPAGGWQSALFSPSYTESAAGLTNGPHQHGVASDQLYSVWESNPEPETFPDTLPHGVYLGTPGGFEPLGQGSLGTDLQALGRFVSAGGQHAIFASSAHLEELAAPAGTRAVYDRAAGSASAEVISVKPDGTSFGAGEAAEYVGSNEAGTAALFTVKGTLYEHREGVTTEVAEEPATFAGVSEDGSRVFYVAAANGRSAAPLAVCDTEAGPCAGPGAQAPVAIAAAGIFVGVAPGGTHAFFSSTEALTGGEENENGETAEAGEDNLYAWDGTGPSFIGRLAAADFESASFAGIGHMELNAWTAAIGLDFNTSGRAYAPTRSTAGGEAFVFQSHARLTAYDNEGKGEIYRYDPGAEAGERLLCVSCDPSGAAPSADALLEDLRSGSPIQPKTMIANLTADGQHVFFQSFDRLLPEDANEAEDVYEWTAQGAGEPGCSRPGGCLALISSGQGETPSVLYAMSADGRDVFLQTKEKLVGADLVGSPSIYDARAGGGIPEPAAPAPCQGDACQGQGSEPPVIPSPSTTGAGEGNEAPSRPRCPKGKHRVKGHCVKKHPHKKHRKHRTPSQRRAHR